MDVSKLKIAFPVREDPEDGYLFDDDNRIVGSLGGHHHSEAEGHAIAEFAALAMNSYADALAALKALVRVIDTAEWGRPWPGRPHAQMDAALAAIAKLEGRS